MSESEAITLAKSGDSTAFAYLYNLHYKNVLGRCRQMLRDPDESEDLAQEVFMQIFQKMDKYSGRSNFSTWLYRITTNKVISHLRAKKSRPVCDTEYVETAERATQHTRVEVLQALERLPRIERKFVEASLEGYPVRNMGGASQLRQGHRLLREALG